MTRRELLARTTQREREEWAAYFDVEPWGEDRADLRMGIVASLIANVNRGRNRPPFKPADFMPKFDKPANLSPDEQVEAVFGALQRKRSK